MENSYEITNDNPELIFISPMEDRRFNVSNVVAGANVIMIDNFDPTITIYITREHLDELNNRGKCLLNFDNKIEIILSSEEKLPNEKV